LSELTPLDPRQSALLLMDFQPIVLQSIADADGLVGRTAQVASLAREKGLRVAYVRVGFTAEDYVKIPTTNKAFAGLRGGSLLSAHAAETAIHEALAPASGDLQMRKTRVGAFGTTDLDDAMTNDGITTLVLAGLHTSGVVLSTVRDAADRDYRLIVLSDCVADPDPHVHELLMGRLFPRQADVVTSEQFAALIAAR
jgi:nicotinamidase-related amidase